MLRNYVNLPRAVHLLCLGTFVNRAGTLIVPFLTIYMSEGLGAGDAFAPVAMGVFGLGSICGGILGGQLADQFGRRIVMLSALLGGAGVLLAISQLTNQYAFLVGVFWFALVSDCYRPAASAMIADLTPPAQRSHAFSLMYVSINLGFAVGPAVGGVIAEFSYLWLFVGDAATCAMYAVIILLGIKESLPRAVTHKSPAAATSGAEGEAAGVAALESPAVAKSASFGAAIRHIAGDRTFMMLCFAAFLIALVFMQSMSTFPLYLHELGFGPAQYGLIISLNGLLIVIGQLPLTNWMHGKNRAHLLVAAAILIAIGFGLKAVAVGLLAFMVTVAIWTLGEMIQFPHLPPIVTELAPENMRARYMGVFGMCFSGGNMIGAPLGGLVLSTFGGVVLWPSCTALSIAAAVIYFILRERISYPPEAGAVGVA